MNTTDAAIRRFVIVGGGKAGTRLAAELRALGCTNAITLFDAGPHLPYDRPPLSKEFLQANVGVEQFRLFPEWFYRDHHIDLRLGVTVNIIDRERQVVRYDGGELAYNRLVLATGAAAKTLSVPGSDKTGIHYLRSLDQALALRTALTDAKQLIVIGAGFIGLEVAASAVTMGCQVTLVEASSVAMGRSVPPALAERVVAEHRRRGASVLFNTRVQAFMGSQHVTGVLLTDDHTKGHCLPCDAVVIGVGAIPASVLGVDAGIASRDGVVVDAHCKTSDANIYALGDVCRFPDPETGELVRLESWRNADEQASHLARVLMGATESFQSLPFFWTDQYGLTLQIVGHPARGVTTVERPLTDGAVIQFFIDAAGRLAGAGAWGLLTHIGKEMRAAEHLIRRGVAVPPADLANPAVNLKSLLKC